MRSRTERNRRSIYAVVVRADRVRIDIDELFIKEATMKITLLAALLAVVGLTACEKTESTTVTPPATTVVETPAAAPATVAVPVPVPGPAGAPGAPGAPGEKGEPGKEGTGDTVIVVPEQPAK